MAANNTDAYEMEKEILQYRHAVSKVRSELNSALRHLGRTQDPNAAMDDTFDCVTVALKELETL